MTGLAHRCGDIVVRPLQVSSIGLAAVWAVAGVVVSAQAPFPRPPAGPGDSADPPGRVGRLAALGGAVSFRAAADTEWGFALGNQPVSTGDRVWSDSDGCAEIDLGDAAVRVWHETEVDVTRLDDHTTQLSVAQGSAIFRSRRLPIGDVEEIDAPTAVITPKEPGTYRIDVGPDGTTTVVSVWSGSAEVTASGSSFTITGHQTATIRGGSSGSPTYDVAQTLAPDAFDRWSSQLDNGVNRALAEQQYLPSDMPGWADLNDAGTWEMDDDYGPVWYPSDVPADWAPYRYGHWVWFSVWGWTWVDDARWGWAPFHYGRWAWRGGRWGWCPGRVIARPLFAPALVVFVGGSGWMLGSGSGARTGYGWFPLAPGEVYRPSYVVSTPTLRRLNVTSVADVTTITPGTPATETSYRNRSVANAVTMVPSRVFQTSAPVARSAIRIPSVEAVRAPLLGASPRLMPTAANVVARARDRAVAEPPRSVRERAVVALHAPPPAPPPLEDQLRTVAANGGRPLTPRQLSTLRGGAVASGLVRRVQSVARPDAPHLIAARPGLPPTYPPLANRSGARLRSMPVLRASGAAGSSSLAQSYAEERDAQESRHVEEFAHSGSSETTEALAARQESEDRALESRYRQAAAAGRTAMPAGGPRGRR